MDGKLFTTSLPEQLTSTMVLSLLPLEEPTETYIWDVPLTLFKIEMYWLSGSLKASITGTITIGNKTLELSSTMGYVDHNWGNFCWADNWSFDLMQLYGRRYSAMISESTDAIRNISQGVGGVIAKDSKIVDIINTIEIKHEEYTTKQGKELTAKYPVKSRIRFSGLKYILKIEARSLGVFPELVLSEQPELENKFSVVWNKPTKFAVRLYRNLKIFGITLCIPLCKFNGYGYYEYTTVNEK
ncbi:MAG: hypothetical protein ACFFAS_09925 [Promethearchaeota archaeon]